MGGPAAARLLLCLLLAHPALGRKIQPKDEEKPPDTKPGDNQGTFIQGTSILVTTNSEGITEVYFGKPNVTTADILQFITGTLNPFSHPGRSRRAVPLVGTLIPSYYPYVSYSPAPVTSLDLARDSMVLVAPIPVDHGKSKTEKPGPEVGYGAYILPKGLSSLPRDLSRRILSAGEGMKKIGLLMLPTDVDFMGATGRQPSNRLFPLEGIKIREIKVVDGEHESTRLEDVLDSLGFAKPGYSGAPWLILRDVAVESVDHKEDPEHQAVETPTAKARESEEVVEKPAAARDAEPVKTVGTIYLGKDGGVTWQLSPLLGLNARIPLLPIPRPIVPPPIAFSPIAIPPIPIPPIPPIPQPIQFPWFNRVPTPNPFYMPFGFPFWNPPNPYVVPVPAR